MDNCVKDKKNHHLLMFISSLITREVFEKIQLGFLAAMHTHEDIDGSFGHLSKKLKEQNNHAMVDLMKHSCFPKIVHSFHNSFKKCLISNFGSMDI
jgi:hypothetical protein